MAKSKRKGKKKRNIIIVLILIVLVGAVVFVLKIRNANADATLENVNYTVVSEIFENIIEVSSIVEAAESQTLRVAGTGTVEAVNVEEGDYVTEGMIILRLNSAAQEYDLAQLDYSIKQKRIIGSAEEVELMQKQRDMIIDQLEDRQVIAMFDGIVAHLDVAEGDVFEAKDSIGTLINRTYLKSTIEVVETDASRLVVGQKVNMTFPAYKKETVYGTVISWPSVARVTDSGSIVVEVEVRIDNPPDEILPNYSFFGNIQINEPETLLFVEHSAIGKEEEQSFVEIMQEDGSVVRQNVTVEPYDETYVKILEGLKEGDVLKAQGDFESGSALQGPGGGSAQGAQLK